MSQTFAQLQDLALHDDFDRGRYQGRARQAILDAVGEVFRNVRLPGAESSYTVPVAAGTASYNLPASPSSVRILSVYTPETSDPLEEVPQEWIDDQPPATGTPSTFSLYGNQIVLFPTPDSANHTVTIRFLRTGGSPNDSDDMEIVTGIPDTYLRMLVDYARAEMFALEDDQEMWQFWRSKFDNQLFKLRADVQRRDVGRKHQIPGMFAVSGGPRFQRPT